MKRFEALYRPMVRLVAALFALAALVPSAAAAPPALRVAVAASAREPLEALARDYRRETGVPVTITPGSSGKLYAQIVHGAPFDLFFSADTDYAAKLEAGHHSRLRRVYAVGRLVLWVPKASPVLVERGWAALGEGGVERLAIANPALAPYGRAAIVALRKHGLYARYAPHLVLGESAAQAAQFVEQGGADAGLLPLSLALSDRLAPRGRFWTVPASDHAPLVAEAVVVEGAAHGAEAERFLHRCLSPASSATWSRYGFAPPPVAR